MIAVASSDPNAVLTTVSFKALGHDPVKKNFAVMGKKYVGKLLVLRLTKGNSQTC